ncbi:MAG TPA: YifB family Mg chelatase-like AAA ATPase [Pusillimonas sp.]|uniref:YifB family Mg chelatase-like AAA ATPase n=1 Tax=unclassified Pusillimonas TaxID=2640016 RepID=UPI00262C58F0|nr:MULTISPECIES: YifB family Mg chelatase-like AAA ATPase [unclassified Pusillimonas]HLU18718.1 YifB family Mg chelatase-like AAA ATPase [Pusillimonas sp.]
MSLAVLASQALCGLQGFAVRVEVHVGPGLPSFVIVGLPDTGVRESRERVRSAIISSGFEFPAGRITVNLAPADLPKESGRFDLAIAIGVLAASGQMAQPDDTSASGLAPDFSNYVFAGELSLTGAIVPIAAPLAIALSVKQSTPGAKLILPVASAGMAAHVPDLSVYQAGSLSQVVKHFCEDATLALASAVHMKAADASFMCMSQVRGQAQARRALEVAASGGHSLLMSGPPGAGKSMLAHRLPGLLPALTTQQSLEVAALASIGGKEPRFSMEPPFRAPHHSATMPALVGGGLRPKPGEISLAHHGVLFLDELPEFQRPVLEALREPIETGVVSIARASMTLSFPARFQLVAAMNPCPCGWLGHSRMRCSCTPDRIDKYRGRISGPLLDRIDLRLSLSALESKWLTAPATETSERIRLRVQESRDRQWTRQACLNGDLDVDGIDQHCVLSQDAQTLLREAMARWHWSGRVVHRVMRVARSLADMAEHDTISGDHIAEAAGFRQPWDDDTCRRSS